MELFFNTLTNHAGYVGRELTQLRLDNYFLWLALLSIGCAVLERFFPWRIQQPVMRKDFWIDAFYMVLNFVLFPLLGFQAAATVVAYYFDSAAEPMLGVELPLNLGLPIWANLLLAFVARDFIQWTIHRLLHRIPMLWRFHRVHHSATELGFAAHLRFHPVETVVYRTIEYLPLALLGVGLFEMFWVHIFAIAVGHLNHTNVRLPLGPFKYILNNPQMHRWHHAKILPKHYGVNFGITLSVWDYLFGTAYIPGDGKDVELGLEESRPFPTGVFGQLIEPFRRSPK